MCFVRFGSAKQASRVRGARWPSNVACLSSGPVPHTECAAGQFQLRLPLPASIGGADQRCYPSWLLPSQTTCCGRAPQPGCPPVINALRTIHTRQSNTWKLWKALGRGRTIGGGGGGGKEEDGVGEKAEHPRTSAQSAWTLSACSWVAPISRRAARAAMVAAVQARLALKKMSQWEWRCGLR